jgi:hypothetical protein
MRALTSSTRLVARLATAALVVGIALGGATAHADFDIVGNAGRSPKSTRARRALVVTAAT